MMHPLLQHKTLLLDLDGTMYRGDAVIPLFFYHFQHTFSIPSVSEAGINSEMFDIVKISHCPITDHTNAVTVF